MRTQEAMPTVERIVAPNLSEDETALLLECINKVRSREEEFYVLLTNRKVTGGHKRLPHEDYEPNPALVASAHKGWLTKAPTNQEGEVYLYLEDDARRPVGGKDGHTNISLQGIRSFEVLGRRPVGARQAAPSQEAPQTASQSACLLMAQVMYLQAQSMMVMAQAMLAQGVPQAQAVYLQAQAALFMAQALQAQATPQVGLRASALSQ